MMLGTPRFQFLLAALTICLASKGFADILANGEPNIEDDRLYAWYDGDQSLGADGIPETPVWPNKQGDPRRDIRSGFSPNSERVLTPVASENGHTALRYVDVVTWRDMGSLDPVTDEYDQWGVLEEQLTIFVAATVRDESFAYFFTGNQGGGGTEANAGYPADFIDPGYWSMKAGLDRIQTAPVVVDQLQFHAFTFLPDENGTHHLNGELVGEGEVGYASLQGFVLGGRQNGGERASVDFAEVLIYNQALNDADRQAIESYLNNKYFGAVGIPGDFNGDQQLTVIDIDLLTEASGVNSTDLKYDLNKDQLVNGDDVTVWVKDLKKTWVGDANVDMEFNSADFVQAFQAGKYETEQKAVWSEGDWDGNGKFASADFITAFQDGGYEQGPRTGVAAVPEPSGILQVGVAITACFIVLRSRYACLKAGL